VEAQERRDWQKHPLLRRLPLLLVVGMGLWLWQGSDVPERELVWRLEGPGWRGLRGVELQVKDADGELLKREEHFFRDAPPDAVTMKVELSAGTYQVWVFERREGGASRPRMESLTLGPEDTRVERGLWAPASR
jgi:hypothetical protein